MIYKSILYIIIVLNLSMGNLKAEIFVHQMHYLKAEQVIPTIKPHLDNNTLVTAKDYQLIINGSQEEYEKIKSLLTQLDKKPLTLMVEVRILDRKLDNWELSKSEIKIINKESSVKIGQTYRVGRNNFDQTFRVRTLEGYQSFVSTGIAFPVHQLVSHYGGFIPQTRQREAKSGFYVNINKTPQDDFRIAISAQQQNRQSRYSQTTNTAKAATVFNAKEGNWILIAASESQPNSSAKNRHSTQGMMSEKRWFYLRVLSSAE
ncbi:hypothetical protein [Aliikangiella sp. G2MR2-5]|uniref:hypothetical protein n=1 Tax=Aliikangiella sp. G2MR2-5 TaxID=2788943 RepID=UPI0018AB5AB5|nr:hypothetical protein [Aliikangiella sp. G2MR2-5]